MRGFLYLWQTHYLYQVTWTTQLESMKDGWGYVVETWLCTVYCCHAGNDLAAGTYHDAGGTKREYCGMEGCNHPAFSGNRVCDFVDPVGLALTALPYSL